jgi:predicted metal-dependent peptidase
MYISQFQNAIAQALSKNSNLCIGFDISASMPPKLLKAALYVAQTISRLSPNTTLMFFDHRVQVTMKASQFDWKTPPTLGGGTDYQDLFDKMTAQGAGAGVVFSDLYAHIPAKPNFPVFWAALDDEVKTTPPYGNVCQIA